MHITLATIAFVMLATPSWGGDKLCIGWKPSTNHRPVHFDCSVVGSYENEVRYRVM